MDKLDILLSSFPLYSEELGINLGEAEGRFRWFLASILFGARISEKIALKTYKTFEKYGVLSPEKILDTGWDGLVKMLDEGGYTRYDFSTFRRKESPSEREGRNCDNSIHTINYIYFCVKLLL